MELLYLRYGGKRVKNAGGNLIQFSCIDGAEDSSRLVYIANNEWSEQKWYANSTIRREKVFVEKYCCTRPR
jgi:hypothetical protein